MEVVFINGEHDVSIIESVDTFEEARVIASHYSKTVYRFDNIMIRRCNIIEPDYEKYEVIELYYNGKRFVAKTD